MNNFLSLFAIFFSSFAIISCSRGSGNSTSNNSTRITNNSGITTVVFSKILMDPDSQSSNDYSEFASEVIKTSEGGYVAVGHSVSEAWPPPNNMDDVLIIKLNVNGKVLWNKKIHHRNYDRATSVVENNEGNYVLTGFSTKNDETKSDVLFAKVSTQGTVLVKKTINISNKYDGGYSISKTSDGGYVIAGEAGHSHNEDFMILKVDKNEEIEWKKRFNDDEDVSAYDVLEASDGNYYLVGSKRIVNKYEDIRIIKTNSNGGKIWDKNFGGNLDDIGEGIVETENNTFVVAASTYSFGTNGDVLLLKIDSNGNLIWQKNYGGDKEDQLREVDGNTVSGRHLNKTPDGGFLVSGYTKSYAKKSGTSDMWVFKTDDTGTLLWNYAYHADGNDYAFSAKQQSDGSVIVFGSGNDDLRIVKIR